MKMSLLDCYRYYLMLMTGEKSLDDEDEDEFWLDSDELKMLFEISRDHLKQIDKYYELSGNIKSDLGDLVLPIFMKLEKKGELTNEYIKVAHKELEEAYDSFFIDDPMSNQLRISDLNEKLYDWAHQIPEYFLKMQSLSKVECALFIAYLIVGEDFKEGWKSEKEMWNYIVEKIGGSPDKLRKLVTKFYEPAERQSIPGAREKIFNVQNLLIFSQEKAYALTVSDLNVIENKI